jgi:hypothetical protein
MSCESFNAPDICVNRTCVVESCPSGGCMGGGCCDTVCCPTGQMCCDEEGPVAWYVTCVAPVNGTCPKHNPNATCADPETPIATPAGETPIALLRPGDLVLSLHHGAVMAVPIERASSRHVEHHRVRHAVLETGRSLDISAGHPTADGRTFGDLRAGDTFFGTRIVAIEDVDYARDETFDILPASDTGTYFAAGVLVGSTLARAQAPAPSMTLAPPAW